MSTKTKIERDLPFWCNEIMLTLEKQQPDVLSMVATEPLYQEMISQIVVDTNFQYQLYLEAKLSEVSAYTLCVNFYNKMLPKDIYSPTYIAIQNNFSHFDKEQIHKNTVAFLIKQRYDYLPETKLNHIPKFSLLKEFLTN